MLELFSPQLLQGYFLLPDSSHSSRCTLSLFFIVVVILNPSSFHFCPTFSSTGCYKSVPASLVLTALIISPTPTHTHPTPPLFPEPTSAHYHPFTQRAAAPPSIGSMPPFRHPRLRPPCRFVTILSSSSSLYLFSFLPPSFSLFSHLTHFLLAVLIPTRYRRYTSLQTFVCVLSLKVKSTPRSFAPA